MSTRKITIAIGAAAAFGLIATPFALADSTQPAGVAPAPTTVAFGKDGKLVNGNTVAEWEISNLKPSTDVLSEHINGTLWEATAEYSAERGSSQPFVPNLNARAADGENYRVLWGAATPQGINPAGLAEGQESKGKIYFDVTGAAPTTSVELNVRPAMSGMWSVLKKSSDTRSVVMNGTASFAPHRRP